MADLRQLAGRRVFVTGGTGFIGRHLLNRLAQLNARVYAVSRAPQPPTSSIVRWYQGDLADLATAQRLLESIRPDLIFHLASHVVGERSPDAIVPTFQSSLMTTVNLLTAAEKVGCGRFVLSGSQDEPLPGNSEGVPCSPYAVTKWASSAYARMFHALYRLPVVILRIFMVYGPAQRDTQKLMPYVILSLLNGDVPKLASGQRPVDWIYVDDVVEALLASALAGHVEGKTIDIGSGRLETVRTVIECIVRLIGSDVAPAFGARPDRPLEEVRVADTKPARELLRWAPHVALEEGLKRTIAWYEQKLRLPETVS